MLDHRLRHVVAVARAGSFTAAAQSAGVTQSAVTKSVADLEREIGYAIFYRTARGVVLTETGSDFVDQASRLLDDARDLLSPDRQAREPFSGVLRIGVGPGSLEWYLTDAVIKLLARHPNIRFDISGSSFERIVQQLRNGALDVAIGFDAAFAAWTDLRREPVGQLNGRLFVRNGHPLMESKRVTSRDLASFNIISPSESRPYGQVFRSFYEDCGVDWRTMLHLVDHFPTVKRMVAASDAIGVVDASYAVASQFSRRFSLLADGGLIPVSLLCAAVRAKWEPKPTTKAFLSVLKQAKRNP
jgi:DNA-binding transcriptional LysR family regulator